MQQSLIIAGMLAGGLGLFMLAVNMITDGLQAFAGRALRDMLGKWTRSPARGVFTGLCITAIVQSSSAITVATIGFVNAGLITLYQALGVIYGSNIGTTMTAWLVAFIGFKLDVDAFALPIIGVGMLLRLTGGEGKRAHIGLALVGFGLFFIGIDVLTNAFDGLVKAIDLTKFTIDGVAGVLLYTLVGFFVTLLTQSSSAAIAIILTAATGGVIGLYAAAAMVIGANVGTTSTAAIAVIGATSNAKRVAAAHIIFNVVTGIVALLTMPLLFWTVTNTEQLLHLASVPAVTLALFHTTFNILGVLLMFPLTRRLTAFLENRFVTQDEIEARPQYLDKTVAVSPILAVNALALELSRVTTIVRRMSLEALSSEFVTTMPLRRDFIVTRRLTNEIARFITRLERGMLSKEVSEHLAKILRSEQHLLACAEQALEIAKKQPELESVGGESVNHAISNFRTESAELMKMAHPEEDSFSITDCELHLDNMQLAYDEAKAILLEGGAELKIPIEVMIDLLEQNSRIRRMSRQMFKAMHFLSELFTTAEVKTPEPKLADETAKEEIKVDENGVDNNLS